MVYYRKYRPQTIAQLDSPKLREILYSILKGAVQNTDSASHARQADSLASAQSVPHAFLFTGPKGLGKTSTARIIAKVLNCTSSKRNGIEPCNECDQCVSITNGNNIDVLEIDGASNRGIDEIRDLRERVNLLPSAARKKVYIIDEVHMLTNEAFNALLKTIEEPPSHVVFIFATTEPQKVPTTIISRCFHISLARASKDELIHALKRIVTDEKIDIADDALDVIAEMGDGGYRDATKLLEEVVALAGDKQITKEFIEKYNNTTGVSLEIDELLSLLKNKNASGALAKIQTITDQGVSIKYFIEQLLSKLHKILLSSNGLEKEQVNAPAFEFEDLSQLISLFSEAYQQTKYAPIPSLPLELAIVAWCQNGSSEDSSPNVIASKAKQSNQDVIPAKAGIQEDGSSGPASGMTIKDMLKKEQNLKVKQVLSGIKPGPVVKKTDPNASQTDMPKDIKDNSVFMENLIYKVKPYNHSVAGVLRGCSVKSLDGTQLILETAYAFHREKLAEAKILEILEKVTREITGKQLRVMVELKQ